MNTSGLVHFLLGLVSSRATGQFIGFIAVLSIVWFAGQIVGLHTVNQKLIAMAAVFGAFILYLVARWFWTKRSGDRLVAELAGHNASSQAEIDEIQTKMQDVLQSLKTSHLGAGYRGNAALYALPWYMIIGPSATGKSTLFANSGLHFPYSNSNELHIQGFGGTRNCDWWFSDQAVLIDTAGRYTTESADNKEWLSFLGLLKKYRPKLPINGIMVSISVADVLTSDSEDIRQHVKVIRERIQELIDHLGVIFPVYVVFTKSDLISGFEPFFADLSEKERDQVWGTYLLDDSEDQSQDPAELFELRMEDLYDRLCEQRLGKMARERNIHRKSLIFDFPNQFKSASTKLTEFVNLLFKQNPYQEVPWFSGIYFTSGTQEGTPVERIVSGVQEQFCSVELEQKQETITKSYFINSVFNDVLFKLQDLTRGNRRQRKIQRWLKGLAVSATLASIAGTTALLMTSLTSNQVLISDGESRVEALVEARLNSSSTADTLEQTIALFEHYQVLEQYEDDLPWHFIFGIYEGDETLDKMRELTLHQIEKILSAPIENMVLNQLADMSNKWSIASDMEARNALRSEYYNTLKLHLMLAKHPEKLDKEFAQSEIVSRWMHSLRIDKNDESTKELQVKLNKMVSMFLNELGTDIEKPGAIAFWELAEDSVSVARLSLDTQPEPDPLYQQIISSKSAKQRALSLSRLLSPANRKLLESSRTVPYAYTKKGWEDYVYPEIQRVVTLASSGDWIMGTANEHGENLVDKAKADALARAIRALYFKDYANTWLDFLNGIKSRKFNGLADASVSLARLSSLEGPFSELMTKVNDNIVLRDTPKKAKEVAQHAEKAAKAAEKLTKKVNLEVAETLIKRVPELENRLADLRRFTHISDKGQNSDFLQQYIRTLSTVHSDLKTLAGSNEPDAQAMEFAQALLLGEDSQNSLQSSWIIVESQLRALEPMTKKALEGLFKSPLESSFKAIADVAKRQLNEEWNNQVYSLYAQGIQGKFPFQRSGADAAIADVAELLNRRSGLLWNFVEIQLKPFLKIRKGRWEERTWNGMGIGFSKDMLSGLDKAQRVSRSLFPKDGENTEFKFQALPIAQRGVRETYIGFSEQSYRYRNEPEEWRRFTWPGKGSAEVARVYGIDSAGRRVSVERSGPWALLRLLNDASIKWQKGTEYSAEWQFKAENKDRRVPLTVKFNLKSGRNSGIFSRSTMTTFKLPQSLFDDTVQVATLDADNRQ